MKVRILYVGTALLFFSMNQSINRLAMLTLSGILVGRLFAENQPASAISSLSIVIFPADH